MNGYRIGGALICGLSAAGVGFGADLLLGTHFFVWFFGAIGVLGSCLFE